MTQLQEEFLNELKSNPKLTIAQYAELYKKHSQLAIKYQQDNGASESQSKAMGNYYTVTVLSDFIDSENILARIIALHESL
ncbi:MAG TPA: hypothetical protein PLM93_00365 [Sulfuricurvum sp.]|nr:MAG: hypothetical protein B7Y30_04155 [Campylobacterales bacterium 16-40-21]OZA03857.1 MAG: hypothetical protein B7X89_04070 [Sulfuricurvum sp. 17-40-25]HQS65623.1 hypothetical protein [Sulfuricurvum sp.]HQT36129.1 hypothetical protein [Sulfuricurvum sp.]